jgi:hypothetical protein
MSGCHHRGEAEAPGRATLSLEPEALFVVGAFRSWVAERRGQRPADVPPWREVFQMAEMRDAAAPAFDRFLRAVERGMRRPLDIRCCRCPAVGADEAMLLRLLAALQAADRLSAYETLGDWLVPEAVPHAMGLAAALAAALLASDVGLRGMRDDAPPAGGMLAQ